MKYLDRLLVYRTSFTVCSGDIKNKKKSSENDQSTGHFQSFFFVPSTLNLKKNSRKSTNKKFWSYRHQIIGPVKEKF